MAKGSLFKTPLSLFLLLIIIAVLQLEARVPMEPFHFVEEKKNWSDAQQHCKENFIDLASASSHREHLHLKHQFENRTNGCAWIGLYRDPVDATVWRWTGERGDASSDTNWATGETAETKDQQDCGCLGFGKRWYSYRCSNERRFICVTDNVILVKENKTWEEALEHCRAIGSVDSSQHNHYRDHQYDLVSLQSKDDHRYARDKIQEATTNEVWTALRFLAGQWLWVDGEPQQYQDLPLCPAWGRHCGTLPKDNSTQWQIRDCMERRNFLCIKSHY